MKTGCGYLLAVSGGVDSICLLYACHALREKMGLRIEVAHLDHRLRAESGGDRKFVEDLCARLKIVCHARQVQSSPIGENVEAWGRRERYTFFRELRIERGLDAILTAHTASDVAETFIMRLLSNKELKSILEYDNVRQVLRPFLTISRAEISEYAKAHDLKWVEDQSNQDKSYFRNKVRHDVLSHLKELFGNSVEDVIARRARYLADDDAILCKIAKEALSDLPEFGSKIWLRALKERLKALPRGIAWRSIEALFRDKLGFNLGRTRSERLLDFVQGNHEGIELPGMVSIRRRAGSLVFKGLIN